MNKGIFITATDTGVGKTAVSSILVRCLIKKGLKVGGMKPLETGCLKIIDKNGNEFLNPYDGIFLKEMACMDEPIDLVTPFRFELPLAPMVASELEKRPITVEKIFDTYRLLEEKYDFMVVEGVGGLLVPITRKEKKIYLVSDLIKDLNLPVLIVSRPTLGTINHTLLTVDYLIRQGIKVKGILINYNKPPENTIAEKTNPDVLKEMMTVPVIATIPFIDDLTVGGIDKIIDKEELCEKILLYLDSDS